MKRSVLTQEGIRILKNCSEDIPWETTAEMMSDFSLRMKLSGYNESYRHNIIQSSISGYEKQKEMDRNDIQPMFRDKNWNKVKRKKDKEKKTKQWFKKGAENDQSFPIFCPCTPNSKLFQRWKKVAEEVAESSRGRVKAKIVEQAGTPLKTLLCKSAPKEDNTCHAEDCHVCNSDTTRRFACRKMSPGGMGYEVQCMTCLHDNRRTSLYHGETSRTLYTRSKEHLNRGSGSEDKPLLKHSRIYHPNTEATFEIRPVEYFTDPLTRQINEGVRINNSKSDEGYLMNSKSEYRQGVVPRVAMISGLQQ